LQFPFFNTPIAALAAPFMHRFGYTFYWPSGTLEDADGGRAAAESARVFWNDCRTRRRGILVGVHVLERAHVVYLCASWGMMIWCALQRCFSILDGYLVVVFVSFFSPTTDILRMFVGCKPRWDIGCKAFTRLLATKSFEKGGSFGRVRKPWIVWKVWKVGSWLIDGSSQFLLNQDTAEAIMARST
jgi:hypothetical protein